jgi:EAL domain-containing protein (putative c-di-GMP-specific phosphodiesterase class I)
LRDLGVRLSVDDFGTGYSSMAYLHSLPVHEMKIDRSFVIDLAQSESARAIVGALVRVGHALGLKVVAEGIETAEVRDDLDALGCDLGQGYHLCRPIPADALTDWVRARGAVEVRTGAVAS